MAWVALAGAVISAIGSIQQGQAAKNAAEYNAEVVKNNAQIARQQGDAQVEQIRRQSVLGLGDMRASFAASGVSMEGSPLDIVADSAYQYELDKQNARWNSEVRATGYDNEGRLSRARGDAAMTGAYFKAGSALLGAAGGAYGSATSTQSPAPVYDAATRTV